MRSVQDVTADLQALDVRRQGMKRYYALLQELFRLLPETEAEQALRAAIDGKQSEFVSVLLDDVENQRIVDLLERADTETDHRCAVALAQRAVRYGRNSQHLKRAYATLAQHYHALGNAKRAQWYAAKAAEPAPIDRL